MKKTTIQLYGLTTEQQQKLEPHFCSELYGLQEAKSLDTAY